MKRVLPAALCVLLFGCGGGSPTTPSGSTGGSSSGSGSMPNLAGQWTLQIQASSSCSASLPADGRFRSYGTVTITQNGTQVGSTFTASVLVGGGTSIIGGIYQGNGRASGPLQFVDFSGAGLSLTGGIDVSVSSSTITGTMNALWSYGAASCTASNHSIILNKK